MYEMSSNCEVLPSTAGDNENSRKNIVRHDEKIEEETNEGSIDTITTIQVEPTTNMPQQENMKNSVDIIYSVLDVPPIPTTIMLSIQQFCTITCSVLTVPYVICPALCQTDNDPGRAFILSTMYFVCGIMTLLQVFFGVRLPIVQGISASFLTPILSIMSLPQFQCPTTNAANSSNVTQLNSIENPEIWHYRIRELQGSMAVASVMQILLSATGLLSVILPFITPLVVIPTLTMIGLSVIHAAAELSTGNWAVSLCTTLLIILSSQHLENVYIPYPKYKRHKGFKWGRITWFKFFPIITAVVIMWVVCAILTRYDVFPKDSPARTDTASAIVANTRWYRFPYPGQWGVPTVSIPSAVGMMSSAIAVIIESIGDYFACARLIDVPAPPPHAVNRGIFVEGFGCLLAGLFGTGSGTTAYAESIGAISITKVGSRIVIVLASVYMLVFGVMTKFTALILSMPKPIMGGLMTVSFSLVAGIGLSTAQYINLNSSRNIFILGFSVWFGIYIPGWVSTNKDSIQTGSFIADEAIVVLLSTSMFVGGVSGFILDNTIPGKI
ncbi:hypothetical protein CHUAL_008694 [Chamberlinius hualienensis]